MKHFLIIPLCLIAFGCGEAPEPEPKNSQVMEDYNRAMDRARQTEQQVMDAAQRKREQIDAQSGEG